MKARVAQVLPLARREQLIIQELPDEVLVYDLERHKAHCLNETSALVWKHCDGKTTVAEMTRVLERRLATPIDDDVVLLALNQLRRFHLLEEGSVTIGTMKVSRRDLVRKYLPAALALPVILSIAAPAAAQAVSRCGNAGDPCTPAGPPFVQGTCCNNSLVCGTTGRCQVT
jgi:hypothetical protein